MFIRHLLSQNKIKKDLVNLAGGNRFNSNVSLKRKTLLGPAFVMPHTPTCVRHMSDLLTTSSEIDLRLADAIPVESSIVLKASVLTKVENEVKVFKLLDKLKTYHKQDLKIRRETNEENKTYIKLHNIWNELAFLELTDEQYMEIFNSQEELLRHQRILGRSGDLIYSSRQIEAITNLVKILNQPNSLMRTIRRKESYIIRNVRQCDSEPYTDLYHKFDKQREVLGLARNLE